VLQSPGTVIVSARALYLLPLARTKSSTRPASPPSIHLTSSPTCLISLPELVQNTRIVHHAPRSCITTPSLPFQKPQMLHMPTTLPKEAIACTHHRCVITRWIVKFLLLRPLVPPGFTRLGGVTRVWYRHRELDDSLK
jgi:hypothetical protein